MAQRQTRKGHGVCGAPTDAGYLSAVETCRRRSALVDNVYENRRADGRPRLASNRGAARGKGRQDA